MKINPNLQTAVLSSVGGERKGAQGAQAASTAAVPSTKVALSPEASTLASAEADPSFDAAKVERMAAAVRSGSYQINPEKIADKLLANARELLSRQRG